MSLTESNWATVSTLFDELVDLPPEERAERLAERTIPGDLRQTLDALLQAHDAPESMVIDRTLHAITEGLVDEDGHSAPPPKDWTGTQLGQWRIRGEIQRGGMATVVLAERADGQYERQVAIKVLHASRAGPEHRQSLEREIRLMAGLSHPGIVHLIDGGIGTQGWPYLVMEYVDGTPIDRWCEQHQASLEARIELLRQVAGAVAHAHACLVVHADLKPANVLVDDQGRARLVDFGIGALLDGGNKSRLETRFSCSPGWAAPEQLQGEAARVGTDVHGLGMLMYALLSDRPPRSPQATARALAGASPPEPPALPSASPAPGLTAGRLRGDLDAICQKATATDAARRYPSAEAFERDLAAWSEDRPVSARQGGRLYLAGKWFRRHRVGVVASSLVALALLIGTALASWQASRAQAEAIRATAQAERAETIKEFLLSMFKAADPWLSGDRALDIQDLLTQGSQQALNDRSLDPSTRLELLLTLGDVQVALGAHEQANILFNQAEALLDEQSTLDPGWRVRLWLERASQTSARRDPQATETALDEARAVIDRHPEAATHRLQVRLAYGYASLFARENREQEAEQAFQRLEALLSEAAEPLIEYQQLLLGSRTVLAYNRGRVEEAHRWAREELELLRGMDRRHGPRTISTLSNLAATAAQLGRLDEALDYDRQAVELAEAIYPSGHPGIATALYAYGDTLRQLGRFEEALRALDRARELRAGLDLEVDLALTDQVRSRTLLALGRGGEAAELAAGARAILEPAWGLNGRTILQALDFELQGRFQARQVTEVDRLEAISRDRLASLDPSDRWQPLAQMLRWRLARIHHELGRVASARYWLEDAARRPPEATRHASVELRLFGLELLLDPADPARRAELIERIEHDSNDPAANADSRAYAWCAVARMASAEANAGTQLAQLIDAPTLSFEGRQDARCPPIRAAESDR